MPVEDAAQDPGTNLVNEELGKRQIDVVDGNGDAAPLNEAPELPDGVVPAVENVDESEVVAPKAEATTDMGIGNQSSGADTNDKQDASEGLVNDKDKAWDIAHSAKDYRDSAAYSRKIAINREAEVTPTLEVVDKIKALYEEADKLQRQIGHEGTKPESPEAQRLRDVWAEREAIKDRLTNPDNPNFMPQYLVDDF